MNKRSPILEVRLHGKRMLRFATGLGALANPEHFDTAAQAWALTGAWRPREPVDGEAIERWLRGLRPQNGARSAQEARARNLLDALEIKRTAPDQGDIVWATPHIEYPGAVEFRSLFDNGDPLEWERPPANPLSGENLQDLLAQVIEEMRLGTTDPRIVDLKPTSPSGSLAKFAAHLSPNDRQWYLPVDGRLSTHIVKHEDRANVPAEAAIESVCQRTLRALGVRAARTHAQMIGNHQAVISERSDRYVDEDSTKVTPIHQEEWACACGRDPDELIQRQGTGGGWTSLYQFLTARGDDPQTEQEHLWRAIAALALLGHRDIHRRNVGVQYPQPDEPHIATLAPLYDVASMDGQQDERWRSLGIPIGGEEEIEKVAEPAWVRMARECHTDPGEVLGIVADVASKLPEALDKGIEQARNEDEWRDKAQAEKRIETLRRGVAKRAQQALRPTQHPRRRPELPEWVDAVVEAMEERRKVSLEANESDRTLEIVVHDRHGKSTRAGTAKSARAFCAALQRAGAINPAEVPELERTLERDRERQLARTHPRP